MNSIILDFLGPDNLIPFIGFFVFLLGLLLCFAGYKLFRILMVILGAIMGGFIAFLLTREGLAIFMGMILGGLLLWFVYQVAIFVAGMILGGFVYTLLLGITGNLGSDDFVIVGFIFAIAGGVLALYWHKFIIILSTAFYGANIMVLAIKIFGIKSIQELVYIAENPGSLLIYTLFFGVLGVLVQYGKLDKLFKGGGLTFNDLKITRYDIQQDRHISQETMTENMEEEFKTLKNVFHHSGNANNHSNSPNAAWHQTDNNYHTQKVPTQGSNIIPVTLVQLSGTYNQQRYTVNWKPFPAGFEALVGKAVAGNNPDVNIPEPVISRKHVRLIQKAGQLFIQHLSTTNPTYKNNQALQPGVEYPLNKGDKLIMGDIHFKVE